MIISKTPLRISFCGGGTDLKEYYKSSFGNVVNTAINKYIYIVVKENFDKNKILLKYSEVELVDDVEDIKHPIFKAALKKVGLGRGLEIVSLANIPAAGTGLGSSSSFTVGLLNALYAYAGKSKSEKELAEEACEIEIDILNDPIGKQDQYAAAYGGLNYIRFNKDESVEITPIILDNSFKKIMDINLMMFYTKKSRKSRDILSEQQKNTINKMGYLDELRDMAIDLKNSLSSNKLEIGTYLKNGWTLKKKLEKSISNKEIDNMYSLALSAGATGGKICGAGGGGFLLLWVESKKRKGVREALKEYDEFKFKLENGGSRIIYNEH